MAPTEQQLDNLAESARKVGMLQRSIKTLKRNGGSGDLETTNEELEAAIERFSAEAYANYTLDEIAQIGGKIQRLAKKCQAIERMESTKKELDQALADHRTLIHEVRNDG